jgi:hypothetical protein
MRNAVVLSSLFALVMIAVFGAFWINGALLGVFEGRAFNDGYTLPAITCIAYACWFAIIGWASARLLRPAQLGLLAVVAVGVFASLVLSSAVWINPAATNTEWIISHVRAYAASFTVFPAFWLVWFFAGRSAPNH